jgi:hypothetical protein
MQREKASSNPVADLSGAQQLKIESHVTLDHVVLQRRAVCYRSCSLASLPEDTSSSRPHQDVILQLTDFADTASSVDHWLSFCL